MESSGKQLKDKGKPTPVSSSQENLRDSGNFEFSNGDRYEGEYVIIKPLLTIFRDGKGTYWTNQSKYTGIWNKDVLEKVDQITFPDNSTFTGTLENMTLEGPGVYRFQNYIEIQGNLHNNQFVGDVELKDPHGHYWRALNPNNENEIIFSPVQPFWLSIMQDVNNYIVPYEEIPGEVE